MICYVLAMGKQHLGSHVVVGYGIKIFWPGLFITSPDHLVEAVGAKWGRQQRERLLESKLKRLGGKNKLVKEKAASNEPINLA